MTGTPQYNWPHACAGRWRGSCRRRVTLEDDGDENRWSVPRSSVISVLLNYESKFQQQNRPAAAARSAPVYGATRSALSGLSLVSAPHLLLSQFYKRLDTNVQSRARQQVLITMIASNFRPALCCCFLGFELWGSDWHWRAICHHQPRHQTSHSLRNFPNHCDVWIFVLWRVHCLLFVFSLGVVGSIRHRGFQMGWFIDFAVSNSVTPFQFCCGYQLLNLK